MRKPDKNLFILLFLHAVVALPLAYFLNIWVDEASTLRTTQHGFLNAFQNVFADEKQAPLYFLILSLWRKLNDSIFFARLFSIVCSLLAIKVFYDLARQFWEDKTAFFIAAIFALHPYLLWASLEIRLYSAVILLSVLLLELFFDVYFHNKDTETERRKQIYFVSVSIVALYTNYYLGFLLVGCFIALIILRRWREAKTYFLQMLVVGVSIVPLLWISKQQFAVRSIAFHQQKSIVEGLQILWNHFLTFVLPTEIFPIGDISAFSTFRLWLVRFAIVAVFVFLIKTKGKLFDEKILALGTIWAVCNLFLLFIYLLLGIKYIEIRHSVNSFAPLILLVGLLITNILPKKVWVFLAVLYAVFFVYGVHALYPNMAKRGDWARIGAYIQQNETPNQPIVIFRNYDALALPYHYQGVNRILPDENFLVWEAEDSSTSANVYRKQTEFIISKIPPDAPEIWLLTEETCQKPETQVACQPLENFVQANYTVLDTKDFYLERVRLLRKK
jgi:uncharacterized membrane protein